MKLIIPKPATLALALSLMSSSSFGAGNLNLATALEQAIQNDPQWAATRHGYQANKEAIHFASAGLKPSAKITGSIARNASDSDPSTTDDNYNSSAIGASISQPLFRLDRWHSYQKGKASDKQFDATFNAERQAFYLRVVKAYLDVLRAEESQQFRDAEKSAIKRQLEQTEQRFNVGLIANTDVQEAKAAFDISSVQQIIAEQDLALTLQNLETLTGSAMDSVAQLKPNAPIAPPLPTDVKQWTESALLTNPELIAASYAKDAALAEYKSKRSAHLPTLDLVGTYNDSHTAQNLLSDRESSSISINLEIPLYTGGFTSAERRQAKQLQYQAEDNFNLKKREIIRNTSNLYRVVNTDVSRVLAQRQSIRSAQAALEATEAGYDAGTRTIVDVLSAQQALYGAKRDYANARYDYIFDLLQLKQTAGTLNSEDITEINSWLAIK
jgi:outer membrane protein